MKELISKIDELIRELELQSPMSDLDNDRLWKKLRLEWNYNSNHIEGNTLTYGETKMLFTLEDKFRPGNNSLKDVQEMKAHDVALSMIQKWSKYDDHKIIEKDIRDLNKIILVKDYWSDAVSLSGDKTRKKIKVGHYKVLPNHVVLKTGEIFQYAEPVEVPAKMEELMNWYHNTEDKLHPLIVSALLHYKFVLIHPFDDGNGRVSRLLMNYHLMKNNFPPIIIKSADKEDYFYALRQADSGDSEPLIKFLGENLLWSINLAIKSAKGEEIEEKEDLNKRIEVYLKNVEADKKTSIAKNDKIVSNLYGQSISNLFSEIARKSYIFKKVFHEFKVNRNFYIDNNRNMRKIMSWQPKEFCDESQDNLSQFEVTIELSQPINKLGEKSSLFQSLNVVLHEYSYSFKLDGKSLDFHFNYSEFISDDVINKLSQMFMNSLFEKVKRITK